MPIKQESRNAFGQYLDRKVEQLRQVLINNLIFVGEAAVTEARQRGRYKDRTGNLRSSIGYCVLDNGKAVKESLFEVVNEGQQGATNGIAFLHSLATEHSSGLVLIVVAGMEYAQYVEAKNLDVIDSAEQLAERLLPQLMEQLKL